MAIKVLIVDDSAVFRQILSKGISMDKELIVVGTAVDAFDARDKILDLDPDVVTCDIEMPKMNGIEFVKRLIPQYPIPVIVISGVSNNVFDALDAGAVDFVKKPDTNSIDGVQEFIPDIISKIKAASKAKVVTSENVKANESDSKSFKKHEIIGIGASTGGTEAILNLLRQLPKGMPGILIVQHIPPGFSRMFADRLNDQTHFEVKEAKNGDVIMKNHVYLAPGDKHMQLKKSDKEYFLRVFSGDKVNGHCPSVDVLFHSIAEIAGEKSLGIILTGMGYDGAKGIALMKRKGAFTIGQDEKSSVVYGMPKAAFDIGGLSKQSPLENIGVNILKNMR